MPSEILTDKNLLYFQENILALSVLQLFMRLVLEWISGIFRKIPQMNKALKPPLSGRLLRFQICCSILHLNGQKYHKGRHN